jgi:hypothetical protein
MATKTLHNQDINKLKEEADSLISGFHAEIGAAGPQTYFRMKGFLERLNRLGNVGLQPFEAMMVNRIVIGINESANRMGVPYKIVRKEGVFEIVNEKVTKKKILISSGRDQKEADKGKGDDDLATGLKQIAKKGPIEKSLPPPKGEDDDEPESKNDSMLPHDGAFPGVNRD